MARISKEKQEKIRTQILEVSKDLFQELGFEKTSTKSIAKQVGIAEGTLFNYFDSKTELFFEVFGEQYKNLTFEEYKEDTKDIVEGLYHTFEKQFKMMFTLPRGLVSEMVIASVKMARKKPERFKKLVEMDFQLMKEIELYLNKLIEKKYIIPVDTKQLSEIIFSIIGYDLIIYIYEKSKTKEETIIEIKSKLKLLLKGYVNGGSHD